MKIKVISMDVTPNGKCFEIETPGNAFYSTVFNVIPFYSIENESYDLDGCRATSEALDVLVRMNSRHILDPDF